MRQSSNARHSAVTASAAQYDAVKRVVDVTVGVLLFLVSLPLFLLIAAAVKLSSAGPAFYRGTRVGRHGREFRQWKFRTMVVDAERLGGTKTSTQDERITGLGRRLRATKLDELPQLINVIRGDMSLVGPRPMVPQEVERYTPFELASLTVRPGVTDWASIWFHNEERELAAAEDLHHYYDTVIRPEKARLRAAYVHSRSLRVDVSIVAQTAFVLLRTRLDAAGTLHCHRPIRLWGHRPTRVAMAVGDQPLLMPHHLTPTYHARELLQPAEAPDRIALRGS